MPRLAFASLRFDEILFRLFFSLVDVSAVSQRVRAVKESRGLG